MCPDEQADCAHHHHRSQVLLDDDVELRHVCEGEDDQVREEDPVLVVLSPQQAPVEMSRERLSDEIDIRPLVAERNVDGVASDYPEVRDNRPDKANGGEDVERTLPPTSSRSTGLGRRSLEMDAGGCR